MGFLNLLRWNHGLQLILLILCFISGYLSGLHPHWVNTYFTGSPKTVLLVDGGLGMGLSPLQRDWLRQATLSNLEIIETTTWSDFFRESERAHFILARLHWIQLLHHLVNEKKNPAPRGGEGSMAESTPAPSQVQDRSQIPSFWLAQFDHLSSSFQSLSWFDPQDGFLPLFWTYPLVVVSQDQSFSSLSLLLRRPGKLQWMGDNPDLLADLSRRSKLEKIIVDPSESEEVKTWMIFPHEKGFRILAQEEKKALKALWPSEGFPLIFVGLSINPKVKSLSEADESLVRALVREEWQLDTLQRTHWASTLNLWMDSAVELPALQRPEHLRSLPLRKLSLFLEAQRPPSTIQPTDPSITD